ncbi:hypothetical protein BDR04DRAFT_352321 [Suillus decipiens]|nr:hypothetical protein BDR04DRAFT_352321 [Suillus decipiens]
MKTGASSKIFSNRSQSRPAAFSLLACLTHGDVSRPAPTLNSFIMGDASSAQREYSRSITVHTVKQLAEWRASLERLLEKHESDSVQDSVDQHDAKGNRRFFLRVYGDEILSHSTPDPHNRLSSVRRVIFQCTKCVSSICMYHANITPPSFPAELDCS